MIIQGFAGSKDPTGKTIKRSCDLKLENIPLPNGELVLYQMEA
jgi:hypothetical protein